MAAELAEDGADVVADGGNRYVEPAGNLPGSEPFAEQSEHLTLARRELCVRGYEMAHCAARNTKVSSHMTPNKAK